MSRRSRLGTVAAPSGYKPTSHADAVTKLSHILMMTQPGLVREEYRGTGLVGVANAQRDAEEAEAKKEAERALEAALDAEDLLDMPIAQIMQLDDGHYHAVWGHQRMLLDESEVNQDEPFCVVYHATDTRNRFVQTLGQAIRECLPDGPEADQLAPQLTEQAKDVLHVGCEARDFLDGLRHAVGRRAITATTSAVEQADTDASTEQDAGQDDGFMEGPDH